MVWRYGAVAYSGNAEAPLPAGTIRDRPRLHYDEYDALNRLVRIEAPAGGGVPASTTLLVWDSAPGCSYVGGNPLSYVDPLGLAKSGQTVKINLFTNAEAAYCSSRYGTSGKALCAAAA